jgi:hypothetical protein
MYHIPKLVSCASFDVLVCNIFFREPSLFLMAGSADFGPERGAILMEMVRVTVSLVTAVTNCSVMMPVAYLQPPWLR